MNPKYFNPPNFKRNITKKNENLHSGLTDIPHFLFNLFFVAT